MSASPRPVAQTIVSPERNEEREALAGRLYDEFGKPLEAAHAGEYVAITPDGRTLLGADLMETAQQAVAAFGPGSYVSKVGERVVGAWR